MAERIVVDATGRAHIEGEPDVPTYAAATVRASGPYPWLGSPEDHLIARIRLEVRDPARFVYLCTAS